jgi:hypothetical protein
VWLENGAAAAVLCAVAVAAPTPPQARGVLSRRTERRVATQ